MVSSLLPARKSPSEKASTLKGKLFSVGVTPTWGLGGHLPVKVDPFSIERQNNFKRVTSPKSGSIFPKRVEKLVNSEDPDQTEHASRLNPSSEVRGSCGSVDKTNQSRRCLFVDVRIV